MKVAIVAIFFSWFISRNAGQQVLDMFTCFSEGVQCDHHNGNNIIDTVMHVPSVEDCRHLCLEDEDSHFISYFDDSAFPVSNLCQLFRSCDILTQCSSCVSENKNCFETCGSNMVGTLDENVLDLIPSIKSEVKCKEKCLNNPECFFYTYFFQNDTMFYNYCFLLTEIVPPTKPCSTCTTAPVDCSPTAACRLTMSGEGYQHLLLNTSLAAHTITVSGGGPCRVTFLLVGSGGHGTYAGGGSGYLEYRSVQVEPGTEITAKVGDQGEETVVTLSILGTFRAWPGEDGEYNDGGDGYSGGGGYGDFEGKPNGGTDGGNGEGTAGGIGTGVDVASYTFSSWTLTAGVGGGYLDSFGGGGGGVLVDGAGPGTGGYPGGYQGQGYGGGGSGLTPSSINDGFQGIILMEINEAV